jgi:hypothetical protein
MSGNGTKVSPADLKRSFMASWRMRSITEPARRVGSHRATGSAGGIVCGCPRSRWRRGNIGGGDSASSISCRRCHIPLLAPCGQPPPARRSGHPERSWTVQHPGLIALRVRRGGRRLADLQGRGLGRGGVARLPVAARAGTVRPALHGTLNRDEDARAQPDRAHHEHHGHVLVSWAGSRGCHGRELVRVIGCTRRPDQAGE